MTITDGYCTLADLKLSLRIADTEDDPLLELAIESASRAIDSYCNRSFVPSGTAATERRFATQNVHVCQVDDIGDTTGMTVTTDDGSGDWATAWTALDWDSEPVNSRIDGQAWPTMRLRAVGDYQFPTAFQALVKVSARWGWPATPTAVKQAAIIQSARIFKRADSPLGVAGFGDIGVMRVGRGLDPDVQQLVDAYRRLGVA